MAPFSELQHCLSKVVEASGRFERQLLGLLSLLSLVYHVALFFLPPPYTEKLFHWALSIGLTLSGAGLWLNVRQAPVGRVRATALAVILSWISFDMVAGIQAGAGVNIWMALDLLLASLIALAFLPAERGLWAVTGLYVMFVGVASLAGPVDVMLLLNLLLLVVFAAFLSLHGLTVADERKQRVKLMQELRFDGLTGVLNRQAIEAELLTLLRTGERALLLMLDLDHFKAINDTYGHLMGDRALQSVAGALHRQTEERGFVGRWGGEEFMALLRVASLEEAAELAERLRVEVMTLTRTPSGEPLPPLTVSIGGVMLSGAPAKSLVADADAALYAAKSGGRNRVILAFPAAPLSSGHASALRAPRPVHQ